MKSDGIQGGWCVLPSEALLCWGSKVVGDPIKPNREGEPEAGLGTEGGRSTSSTEDSGPMTPGNRAEDKTLKTRKSIAANGDVANKIGTYGLAVAARYHGVKVMVAAPTSTIDLRIASGAEIPIEVRDGDELLYCGGRRVAAAGAEAWNPVFDVTPAALVDAIVTEQGVVLSPNEKKIRKLMED